MPHVVIYILLTTNSVLETNIEVLWTKQDAYGVLCSHSLIQVVQKRRLAIVCIIVKY
jgi:hypothetical protein